MLRIVTLPKKSLMKTFTKTSFLLAITILASCRSHKKMEESSFSSKDSCTVQTSMSLQSFTNVLAAESISSSLTQDHFDFHEGAGEILIHTNGDTTIKGLRSAVLARKTQNKESETHVSLSAGLSSESHSESSNVIVKDEKTVTNNLTSSNLIRIRLLLIVIILIAGLLSLKHIKDRLNP